MGAPVQPMVNVSDIDALLFHSSSFRHISGGQFRIKRLQLVDRFGQVAPVAGSWGQAGDYALDNKNCFVAPAMSAPQDLITKDAKHFSPSIQIPPRLLQPARLEFHLRSVGQSLDGLAGWWIWNRYNRALMVHSAQGKWLGMLHGIADGHAVFESAPGVPSLEELAGAGAQLSQELLAPLRAITAAIDGAARLDALGQLLDEAGWRIDPADEHGSWLSVLTGRPLAVVGASIRLTLEQQALSDPSFIHAFQDQGPATDITKLKDRLTRLALPNPLEQPLPLVIGDAHDPEEGLVGLWLADDFEVMRSPYASAHGPHPSGITFLDADHPLHASFADKEALHVTLLMDPFAKVYACCGLLPDQALSLPPQSLDDALRAMVPAFPMGPLLVEYEARADHATPGAYVEPRALLHTPIPPHEYGEWQWVDGSGEIFNLRHPGQEAHLDGRALHVRDGRMVLNPHHDEKNFSVK
jgi:hypothetical protein